jgi:hypothetical protein
LFDRKTNRAFAIAHPIDAACPALHRSEPHNPGSRTGLEAAGGYPGNKIKIAHFATAKRNGISASFAETS